MLLHDGRVHDSLWLNQQYYLVKVAPNKWECFQYYVLQNSILMIKKICGYTICTITPSFFRNLLCGGGIENRVRRSESGNRPIRCRLRNGVCAAIMILEQQRDIGVVGFEETAREQWRCLCFNPFRMKTPKYLFPRGNKPLLYHQIGNINFFIFITNQ